ncbi:hypothetical protein [Amaricoccus sp.]|uniref:hypothetical protein n=1 Tax=Amaricoccus sp. TaxID=1872485 RepID=UPI00262D6DF8|nr:hypothetical protein [uncultured Amaricoccus sp.]
MTSSRHDRPEAGAAMARAALLLAGLLLAGCSVGIPGFLGREGNANANYGATSADETPDPVPLPLRLAVAERAASGVILRVEGVSPTQGFYEAALLPLNDGKPDAAGIVSLELVAIPPATPGAIGPERTRALSAAAFYPNRLMKPITGFRVRGGQNVITVTAPVTPAPPPVLATDIPTL